MSPLAQARLIDRYQMVVNPLVLGRGRTLFEGVAEPIALKLTSSRVFPHSGNIVLGYEPA